MVVKQYEHDIGNEWHERLHEPVFQGKVWCAPTVEPQWCDVLLQSNHSGWCALTDSRTTVVWCVLTVVPQWLMCSYRQSNHSGVMCSYSQTRTTVVDVFLKSNHSGVMCSYSQTRTTVV